MLHPAGWVYLPSSPSIREPVPVIKDAKDYEELVELGPVEYSLKVHKEKNFVTDLKRRLEETPNEVASFVEEVKGWEVAFYFWCNGSYANRLPFLL